ncbi:MAG: 7-carboxy-7-deazaguanine synthase QueE [Dysgonamonadaceae bacterium]|jgi:organic radical activating enzyme|nr:7-carboxy-7-deazaguanine synthase QueE [Dysgonamonadaceae bacterium]
MNLNVNEIFYSLQGEGGRQGEASIFIRLSNCNLKCDFCDTDYSEGKEMNPEQILEAIKLFPCQWIVWTGGEPALQLTGEILLFFKKQGYLQAIESNGHRQLPDLLDYIAISPKGLHTEYARKINPEVDEVRLPVKKDMKIPPIETFPMAKHYFLSPVFSTDEQSTHTNIRYCVNYIKNHPEWRLSVQMHKLIGIA